MTRVPAIEIKQLKKTYDNGVIALDAIDLRIEQGDFFALLGANGAGKSTVIGIIASLINKTSGDITILGIDHQRNPRLAKRKIGLVPQEFNLHAFQKCGHILVDQAAYYGVRRKQAEQRARLLLEQLGLATKYSVPSGQLSGGMKRRLMIARALMHQPDILLLDEPTAGVDVELRQSIWQLIRSVNQQGTTIILTTHYLEEAEQLCHNVAIIDHGNVIKQTSTKQLLAQLEDEVLILQLTEPLQQKPALEAFHCQLTDADILEVCITKPQTVTALLAHLTQQGITVSSIRTKENRLERLFIHLIQGAQHD